MKRSKEIKITKQKQCARENVLLSSALNLEGERGSESDVGILHTNTGLETLT